MCWFDGQIGVQSILALYSKHKNASCLRGVSGLVFQTENLDSNSKQLQLSVSTRTSKQCGECKQTPFFLGQSRHHFNVPINQFQFSDRALADCCWPVAATSGAVGIWLRWCFPTLHETSYWNRRSKHWLPTCLRWTSPGLVSRLVKNQKVSVHVSPLKQTVLVFWFLLFWRAG